MNQFDSIKGRKGSKEELVRCPICDDYFDVIGGFYCPKCRRGPLCKKHRASGTKECLSCTLDTKLHEINALRGQEQSIKSFVSFIQFVFLVFSVLFIALQFGVFEEVEFLRHNTFTENLIYIGLGAAVLYAISYVIRLGQRKKIVDLGSEIESMGMRRY